MFSKTSNELRDTVGMNIKETRYLLRILEKYRSVPPAFFLLESSVMELISMRGRVDKGSIRIKSRSRRNRRKLSEAGVHGFRMVFESDRCQYTWRMYRIRSNMIID